MSMLEVRDLTVDFGAKRVVDRVSFMVEAGEKFALVGESGSGKTVTALSLLRLAQDARVSGEVVFNGIDVAAMAETPLREMRGRVRSSCSTRSAFRIPRSGSTPIRISSPAA